MTGCATCGKPLSRVNQSGYCRKHFGALNSERTREQCRRQWADPAYRIKHIGAMRRLGEYRLAWCPLEYREDYWVLKRVKHYSAAQARAMIEESIATDLRRYEITGQLQRTIAL